MPRYEIEFFFGRIYYFCSKVFEYKGKKYKIIVQNRVNMQESRYIKSRDYIVTGKAEDIRPYGILFKKIV